MSLIPSRFEAGQSRVVWIVNHYAEAPDGVGPVRHFQLARCLRAHGWETYIIASSHGHWSGRERLHSGEDRRLESKQETSFLWIRTPSYLGNGVSRMLNMLAFAYRVLDRAATASLPPPDVVIGSTVHPFAAWSAARLAKRHNAAFVFEIRDLWPQTLIDLGRLSRHGVQARLLGWLERWLCRRASRVVTLLPGVSDYLDAMGVDSTDIVYVPNGVRIDEVPMSEPPDDDSFTLMYLGAHGNANALETLLRAMVLVGDERDLPRINCRLIGDGPLKPSLQAMAHDLGLPNISFEPAVSRAEVADLGAAADAFVLCTKNLPNLYRYGVSMNKLYDYMAMARPTVLAMNAYNNPIADCDGGVTVPPGDARMLATAISSVARLSFAQRREMGSRARSFVAENYGFEMLSVRLAVALEEVAIANDIASPGA